MTYQGSLLPSSDQAWSPFELFQEDASAACLIVCDHASNHVPAELDGLGLPASERQRHIAWDIGAASVARRLASCLGAPAVFSSVSRLVIDCNRPLGQTTSICAASDGTAVPGNLAVSVAEAERRADRYFHPYHQAIAGQLDRLRIMSPDPALVAIHSFTPLMQDGGGARPWHVGVLWNQDGRLALPLLEALRGRDGLVVGDNQPYSGRSTNYTLDRHGDANRLPHVSVEIRQDLIACAADAFRWGDILADILGFLLDRRAR